MKRVTVSPHSQKQFKIPQTESQKHHNNSYNIKLLIIRSKNNIHQREQEGPDGQTTNLLWVNKPGLKIQRNNTRYLGKVYILMLKSSLETTNHSLWFRLLLNPYIFPINIHAMVLPAKCHSELTDTKVQCHSLSINANLTAEINANEMNAISFGIEYNDQDFKLFWISQILKTWRRSIMDRRSKSQNLSAENYNPLWESFKSIFQSFKK